MEEMGWVESKRDVWDTDCECPHEITWADVVVTEEVGRAPREDPCGLKNLVAQNGFRAWNFVLVY